MEIVYCTCSDVPPHLHVPERLLVRKHGREFKLDRKTYEMNSDAGYELVKVIPASTKIAVDWREYARVLIRDICSN